MTRRQARELRTLANEVRVADQPFQQPCADGVECLDSRHVEQDALRTMGFDPVEVLVLPRIVALIIAVPLLTFLGAMAALYGAELVCTLYGGMEPEIFLSRLREAISAQTFAVGMIKAPFMALVIGLVACVEGFEVEGSAASLGQEPRRRWSNRSSSSSCSTASSPCSSPRSGCDDARQRNRDQRARPHRRL